MILSVGWLDLGLDCIYNMTAMFSQQIKVLAYPGSSNFATETYVHLVQQMELNSSFYVKIGILVIPTQIMCTSIL